MCHEVDRGDDGREEPQSPRVAESMQDDPGVDSAKAIQEGLDPEAEGPPVDDVCVVLGLILTSPLRAHRWDDAAADPWVGLALFESEWRRKGSHRYTIGIRGLGVARVIILGSDAICEVETASDRLSSPCAGVGRACRWVRSCGV